MSFVAYDIVNVENSSFGSRKKKVIFKVQKCDFR